MIFNVDISWKRAHFVEGSSGVVIFSIVNVEEDGIFVGVEGVKGMSFFDSSK